MYKHFILILILLFSSNVFFAQKNTVHLISSSDSETVLSFNLSSYDFKDVLTKNGNETILLADELSQILQKGAPDLPKFSTSMIIPDKDLMAFEVTASKFIEIENVSVAPSKGNLTRDINPNDVPFEYDQKIYSKDAFFPYDDAQLNNPFIVRDYRGQALHVYPVKYNPVKKILRIYTEITVRVYSTGQEGDNILTRTKALTYVNTEFKHLYASRFINYGSNTKYTPVEEEGNMLIICYDAFMDEMAEFVTWKNTIGRPTEIVPVSTIGTTATAIKTYVTNYYNTNGLAYLLLVGDAAQIPTNSGGTLGGDSDNAYAYILGNDHYLDFFVGRFSAENEAQVITQVQRTLTYENGSTLASGWLNVSTGIASDQGPGDDNEYDWQHIRNIQTQLVNDYTYTSPYYEIYDGSQGGFDVSGDATVSQVSTAVNMGTGIITYTGHGSDNAWSSSGFSSTNVDALTNDNKLPFIWSVACVNGNFVGQTCFGEAWMRSTNGSNPAGAIGIMASTINQSWDPPMAAQDEMVDILVESYANNIKRTFAGLSINGCHLMNDEYQDYAMTDTWTCFGDPSLYVRTDNTSTMAITHDDVVIIGVTEFSVACDLNGALATLSREGTIIGSAEVSGGVANVPVSGVTPGETLTLAVIGFNKVTYLASVNVIAPSGPYLIVDSYVNEIDFGQTENINITLENVGLENATGVSVTVSESDPNASITNATFSYGGIAAGTTSDPSSESFTLTVDNDLEDGYVVALNIAITDGSKTLWQQTKNVTVNAPILTVGNLTINDAEGNADGILDPGETADVLIQTTNTGHADVSNVIGQISTTSPYLILNTTSTSPVSLLEGEAGVFSFNVMASAAAEEGTLADLLFSITGGAENQYSGNNDFDIVIGFVPEYCEASGGCDEYISRVQFGTIDNSSSCDGYHDYTAISSEVDMGSSYPITVTVGTPYSSDALAAYVDWNYDGDFTDAGESFPLTWASPNATGNIMVPEGITPRNLTMRIRLTYNSTPAPCGTTTYGEVEDYTLTVLPGITQGGTLNATNSMVCIGSSTGTITLSNNSGTVTDWEKRLNGGAWTSIGNTASTYSETTAEAGTWEYRVAVDAGAAYSTVVSIVVNPLTVSGSVSGGSTVCEGENTGTLTLSGHIGNVQRWQKQLNGGTWSNITNSLITYSEIPSADGTWSYRAVVKSGVCSEADSESTDVLVNPSAVSGTATVDDNTICTGSTVTLTLTSYEGSIQWQVSDNGTDWSDITDATTNTYATDALTANTWYRAVVSLGECNDAVSNSVAISISENPVSGFTFVADNQTLTFTNTSTNATSYSWDFGDTFSSTQTNPVHTFAAAGNYTVVLTAINGVCPDNEYEQTIAVTYVGVDDLNANVLIQPNPSDGRFFIQSGNYKMTSLSIYNVSGQKIYETVPMNTTVEVDLNQVVPGIYFIEIIANNMKINKKLILK
jgi:hypothetical protein